MKFFILLTVLLPLNLFSSNSTDRILVAKEIITLDDRYQDIDAIFIKGDRIHSVGSKDKISKEFPDIRVDTAHENDVKGQSARRAPLHEQKVEGFAREETSAQRWLWMVRRLPLESARTYL